MQSDLDIKGFGGERGRTEDQHGRGYEGKATEVVGE